MRRVPLQYVPSDVPNRFTDGKGWLQGTQAFLQIAPLDRPGSPHSGTVASSAAPSSGATKGYAADAEDAAHLVITVCRW